MRARDHGVVLCQPGSCAIAKSQQTGADLQLVMVYRFPYAAVRQIRAESSAVEEYLTPTACTRSQARERVHMLSLSPAFDH